MNLFDSHCHLESENFQNDLPQVMQRMAQAGVRRCVLAGSDLETSRRIVALARKHEGGYGAVGVHPHAATTWTDETDAERAQRLTKANQLQEAARFCPADRLLVETDSPYLAPVPMRGKRNEPAFVHYVAEVVAQLRGVSTEELADTAACNACRLFGIPEE